MTRKPYEVWIINDAIMSSKQAGTYADELEATNAAIDEARGKRAFVRVVVLNARGIKVHEVQGFPKYTGKQEQITHRPLDPGTFG